MTQTTGLSALTAVLQHEMGDHVKDLETHIENLEHHLAAGVEVVDGLRGEYDDVRDDFVQFQGNMASMNRALCERMYPLMSDECKQIFASHQLGFWYILRSARLQLEDPTGEGSEPDDGPEAEEIANDPIQWPMFNGRYLSEQ